MARNVANLYCGAMWGLSSTFLATRRLSVPGVCVLQPVVPRPAGLSSYLGYGGLQVTYRPLLRTVCSRRTYSHSRFLACSSGRWLVRCGSQPSGRQRSRVESRFEGCLRSTLSSDILGIFMLSCACRACPWLLSACARRGRAWLERRTASIGTR